MNKDLQAHIERSIFESIRKKLVQDGYLPDIMDSIAFPTSGNNFTATAQSNWDAQLKAIASTKKFSVELFSTGSAFNKGQTKAPRIVIVHKRIMPGDIGAGPIPIYNPLGAIFERVYFPDVSINMHFDIHLISQSTDQSRYLNYLLSTSVGVRRYLPIFDNITQKFFIKQYNYYDLPDPNDGEEENVYSYEVSDIYLYDDSPTNITQITPINIINTDITLGYKVSPLTIV